MKKIKVIDVMDMKERVMTVKEFEGIYGELPLNFPNRVYSIKARVAFDGHDWLSIATLCYNTVYEYVCSKVYGSWKIDFQDSYKITKEEAKEIRK